MARNGCNSQKGLSEAGFGQMLWQRGAMPCGAGRLALARWFRLSRVRRRWPLHCKARCAAFVPVQRLPQADLRQGGTIFASSKLPLRLWFKAIYLVTQSRKGISSIELVRRLGSRRRPPG